MRDLSPRPLRLSEHDRALYVDHEPQVAAVLSTLRHGGNVLLLGERGSGKTSLLHHAARHLMEEGRNVAVIDGRVASSPRDLIALLRDEVVRWPQLRLDSHERSSDQSQLQMSIQPAPTSARLLLDELRLLRAALQDREPGIVFVDELGASDLPRSLFGRLRDELWEAPLSWGVAADVGERAAYTTPPADAFWSRVVELRQLSDEAAQALLARRDASAELTGEALEALLDEAGGNPRRLISLARAALEDPESADASRAAREERAKRLKAISDPARRLFEELEANGASGPSDVGLQGKFGWTRSRASQVFKELDEAGLVTSSTKAGVTGRPRRIYEVA